MKKNIYFRPGINKSVGKIRIVEISPIQIGGKLWFCVGYELKGQNKKDQIHLGLILNNRLNTKKESELFKLLNNSFGKSDPVLTRLHSECLLGDALMSEDCDCRKQLVSSINMILKNKQGVLIYLRQEGRDIGLRNKLSCLSLQGGYLHGKKIAQPFSSDQANVAFGHPVDSRDYRLATTFLKYLGVKSVNLISGNPDKLRAIEKSGIKIAKLADIPRDTFSKKEEKELREKLKRNYIYPFLIEAEENV